MQPDWDEVFDHHGEKVVTKTDKDKSAYVLNKSQRAALSAAGIEPREEKSNDTFFVEVLFDPAVQSLEASYYLSRRKGSLIPRTPEARLGRAVIGWAQTGDTIILGNIGNRILATKRSSQELATSDIARELVTKVDPADVLAKAKMASGKPLKLARTVTDFRRNTYVVVGAIVRSDGACELPGCSRELFLRDNGSSFLEVHHVVPLAEGGDDTLVNAAALCPACHRELHFGAERHAKRVTLAAHIAGLAI